MTSRPSSTSSPRRAKPSPPRNRPSKLMRSKHPTSNAAASAAGPAMAPTISGAKGSARLAGSARRNAFSSAQDKSKRRRSLGTAKTTATTVLLA
eukprot:5321394-Pyramimonas_sp.AAC.1